MKRTALRIPLSVMTAGAVMLSMFAMTGFAATEDDNAFLPVGDLAVPEFSEEIITAGEGGTFDPNDGIEDIDRWLGAASASDKEFLTKCAGSRWGYNQLNSSGKRAFYNEIFDVCVELWGSSKDITADKNAYSSVEYTDNGLTPTEATDVFMWFVYDNPQFYFLPNGFSGKQSVTATGEIVQGWLNVSVIDDYKSGSARQAAQKTVKDFVTSVGDGACSSGSAYERAKYIHDKINNELDYGENSANIMRVRNIGGVLTYKKSVCEGYSKLFSVICHYAGIDAVYAIGTGKSNAGTGGHAWNLAKLDDGKYYYFDVTWDDNLGKYVYFAKGSETFDITHEPYARESGTARAIYELPVGSKTEFDPNNVHTTHTFGSWKTTAAATCTTAGTETRTCTVCGETETRTIAALGHSYTSTVTAPTYTHGGYTTHTCTRCGTSYKDKYTDQLSADIAVSYKADDGCVLLSWTKLSGVSKYAVCGYAGGKWQKLAETSDTSYLLRGMKNGTKYSVSVIPLIDGNWHTDFSNAITVVASPKYPVVKTEVSGKQFRLTWSRVMGAEKYGVAYYMNNKWNMLTITAPTVSTYTSPKLPAGTYTVAVCAKVNGEWDTGNLASRMKKITIV